MKTTKRGFKDYEAAYYLGLSVSLLRKARCDGRLIGQVALPRHIKVGKSVLYLKEDLDSWLHIQQKSSQTNNAIPGGNNDKL